LAEAGVTDFSSYGGGPEPLMDFFVDRPLGAGVDAR